MFQSLHTREPQFNNDTSWIKMKIYPISKIFMQVSKTKTQEEKLPVDCKEFKHCQSGAKKTKGEIGTLFYNMELKKTVCIY